DDPELQRMLSQLQRDATAAVQTARESAESAGVSVASSAQFREATSKEQESRRLAQRPDESLFALWEAATLYSQAAEQARAARQRDPAPPAAAPPPPVQTTTVQIPAPQTPPPQTTTPQRVEQPPPPERLPAPTPRPSTPLPPPPPSPAAIRAADEAAIRSLL